MARHPGVVRQLGGLGAAFGVGVVLVLVLAVVAPGAARIEIPETGVFAMASTEVGEAWEHLGDGAPGEGVPDGGGPHGAVRTDGDTSPDDETHDVTIEAAPASEESVEDADETTTDGDGQHEGSGATTDADQGGGASGASSGGTSDGSAAGSGGSSGDPATTARVLELVNAERAAAGCGPVSADASLDALALAHSVDMATRDYFDHTSPDGVTPWDRAQVAGVQGLAAENIARGQRDADAVVRAWMDSPGHRANILECSHTRHGLGVHHGSGGPWWTQVFGR